jgi:hypothetical protein
MTIAERLSDTGCSMTEDATGRNFQRAITNILPCRATSSRSAAVFDPAHAGPFVISEILAVRDDPDSPVYVARVTSIAADSVSVQCYGCTTPDLARAVFQPCWHLPNENDIALSETAPAGLVPCLGELHFNSLRDLLTARNLEFTAARRLRKPSQRALASVRDERALASVRDELFIF